MIPIAQARKDFMEGCGIDENPFLPHTQDWWEYSLEMHRLWMSELKAEREGLGYAN